LSILDWVIPQNSILFLKTTYVSRVVATMVYSIRKNIPQFCMNCVPDFTSVECNPHVDRVESYIVKRGVESLEINFITQTKTSK
jgi:hypothetical protein